MERCITRTYNAHANRRQSRSTTLAVNHNAEAQPARAAHSFAPSSILSVCLWAKPPSNSSKAGGSPTGRRAASQCSHARLAASLYPRSAAGSGLGSRAREIECERDSPRDREGEEGEESESDGPATLLDLNLDLDLGQGWEKESLCMGCEGVQVNVSVNERHIETCSWLK